VPNNILITPGSASIQFSGSANNDTIRLQVEASGSVAFYGNSGSLFSITDQLSGSLMSVNDISGLPILEVFSDDRVVMGTVNRNTLVVTGSRVGIGKNNPSATLDVSGSVITTGSLRISGSITGSGAGILLENPTTTLSILPNANYRATSIFHTFIVNGTTALLIDSTATSPFTTNVYSLGLTGNRFSTGFINNIVSSGSITNTGSINILSGSINVTNGGFTGSLLGTASLAQTASYFSGSITFPNGLIVTGGLQVTSISASSGIIGNLIGTSSWASNASTLNLTSSAVFATTGSNVFVGNQRITGSLILSSSALVEMQVIGDVEITGSLRLASGGITSSLFGTSSWASNVVSASFATTASFAASASWAPSVGGVTSLTAGDGLTGGTITSTGTIALDTGSAHFLDGVKKELNTEGVISSSAQVKALLPVGTVSSSEQINTGSFTGSFTGTLITPILSASIFTGSHVQLTNVVDTVQTNKVLVLDTTTNKIFTTASVGGGGGTGTGFPYDGTVTPAIISGSLILSSSINSPLTVSGSVDNFFELEVVNFSAGNNASADVVVSSNNTTDFGNYAAFGINSTTYNAGLVGGASDGYIYLTSSVGELDIGHAGTGANANVRLFAGGPNSTATTRVFISSSGNVGIGVSSSLTNKLTVHGNVSASGYTGSFTGPLTNIPEMSMAVSGAITASGTVGIELNLNTANYFSVSASGTGTVTWTVINPPPTGRAQTFIIEYTNGGIKTNNWFTNTRWPAGVAPSLTSASANPDLLGFTTDDAGSNWRGVLLQRGSA
jgi:hypothetical protein